MLRRFFRSMFHASWRHLLLFGVTLLAYLVQSCVLSPFVHIGGITPNLLMATLAVVAVGYGQLQSLWSGAMLGILLEVMQPSRPLLNLLLYPISAFFTASVFSNKSDQQLAYERSVGKAGRDINPLARVMMCAATNTAVYEVVNIAYIYLRGADLNMGHIGRGMLNVLLSTLLSIPVLLLLRKPFGIRRVRREQHATPYTGAADAQPGINQYLR